jgi:hypothetical protein
MIPGSVQVSGKDSDEAKEDAFRAFESGSVRVLVTKPTIAGFGLNWQHCAHQTFFPSHSFEQWYQAIRRSWRFGQNKPVVVDMSASEGEQRVMANLERKAEAADRMFSELVRYMADGRQNHALVSPVYERMGSVGRPHVGCAARDLHQPAGVPVGQRQRARLHGAMRTHCGRNADAGR